MTKLLKLLLRQQLLKFYPQATSSMRNDYWLYFDLLDPNWCDYLVDYATENYPTK